MPARAAEWVVLICDNRLFVVRRSGLSTPRVPTLAVLIQLLLILGFILPSIPVSHASSSFPPRTWYFRVIQTSGSSNSMLGMNESLPDINSLDPNLIVRGSPASVLPIGLCNGCGASLFFPLRPSYPFGFDIEPGSATFEMWAAGANTSQVGGGINAFDGASAQFLLNLTTSSGTTIASTVDQVALSASPYNAWTWAHSLVTFQVPAFSIPANSPVSLNITWTNPANDYEIFFGLDTTVHHSSLTVPADYYSTKLTLNDNNHTGNGTINNPYGVNLGNSIRISGSLTNLNNASGISGAPVTIILVNVFANTNLPQSLVLATVLTSNTGAYSYDWSPSSSEVGFYGAAIASWPGSHNFSANVSQTNYGPNFDYYHTIIAVEHALTSISIQLGVPASSSGSAVEIYGKLTGLHGPINGANIVLYFQVPGSGWTTITSAPTNATGSYDAVWMLQATGNFTLQAAWGGDSLQNSVGSTTFLSSIYQSGTLIWVTSSASPVNSLTFSQPDGTLSFSLSEPALAGSFVTISIPKAVSGLSPNGPLKVGAAIVTYSVVDAKSAWLVSFSLPGGSQNLLQIVFGPFSSQGSNGSVFTVFLEIEGLVAATAIVITLAWSRLRRTPSSSIVKDSAAHEIKARNLGRNFFSRFPRP